MISSYKKSTESLRDNDVENASTDVYLAAKSVMVKERADHLPVVISKK